MAVHNKTLKKVLGVFKALHKARKSVFQDDTHALQVVRNKINEEFKKNKQVKNEESIDEMIKLAKDVEIELRTSVVQAVQVAPGKYEAKIREETTKMDNVPFQDVPEEVLLANKKKASRKCGNKEKT